MNQTPEPLSLYLLTFICPVVSAGADGTAWEAWLLDVVGLGEESYCATMRTGRRKKIADPVNILKSCNRKKPEGV